MPGEYYNPDVNKKKKKQKKSKAATSSSGAGSFAFDGISPYELQIDVINSSLRARGKKRIDYKKSSDTKGRDNDKNNNSTGTLMQSAIIRTGNAADEVSLISTLSTLLYSTLISICGIIFCFRTTMMNQFSAMKMIKSTLHCHKRRPFERYQITFKVLLIKISTRVCLRTR